LAKSREIPKSFVHVPKRPRRTFAGAGVHAIKGMLLVPPYWALAALNAVPGLSFRAEGFVLGLRTLLQPRRQLSLASVFHLLFMPMESTRYFEFDFASKMLLGRPMRRYLDISSPRLLPAVLLSGHPEMEGHLINPNHNDLDETRRVVDSIGANHRCHLHSCLITDAPFEKNTFDAITSISVVEHIPDDLGAVQKMWTLLKPGGVLVLTVPCMAQALEQYIDQDQYGLLKDESDSFVFWQRFYDQELLEQNIFSVTGQPLAIAVYGEKQAGLMLRNSERKRADLNYPYWREPYMMAVEHRYFDRLGDLPGEGVVGMLFVKPA
jgi:SAM-dependent methyltransferase